MSFFKPTAGGGGGGTTGAFESFDSDLSNYSLDTGQATIVSSPAHTNGTALELQGGGSGGYFFSSGGPPTSMILDDSFNDPPQPGDDFTFMVNVSPDSFATFGLAFGDYSDGDWYGVGFYGGADQDGNEITQLVLREGGTENSTTATIPASRGEWVKIGVRWPESGPVGAIHEASGTTASAPTDGSSAPSTGVDLGWFTLGGSGNPGYVDTATYEPLDTPV